LSKKAQSMQELLEAALAHHRAGRLDEATSRYRLILSGHPQHPDALHFLGVVLHQRGDHAQAVDLIRRAVLLRPEDAACYCNLAEAHRALGQLQEAETGCRKALALRPEYPEALLNLAVVQFTRRQLGEAEEACRAALRMRPDFPAAALTLADVLREEGRIHESLEEYDRALELAPDLWAAHANYGLLLVQGGQMDDGLRHCRRAVELAPLVALPYRNLGRVLLAYGRIDEAMEALGQALKLDPNSSGLCLAMGAAWVEMADFGEAKRWFERALALSPELTEARCSIGDVLLESGDVDQAAEVYRGVLERDPERVEALAGLARARLEQGDVEGSVACYRESLRVRPEAAGLHAVLGQTLSTAGDLAGAVACQRKAIELNPRCVPAYGGLLTTLGGKATDAELLSAEELLTYPWMTDDGGATLHFGLAHAYDGRGQWALAADHMVAANALKQRYLEERDLAYDPAAHTAFVDGLIGTFTPELFDRVRGFVASSERPVFVVGMPRSGTTLTEQILASHPRVFGAGERPFASQAFRQVACALGSTGPLLDRIPWVDGTTLAAAANWHLEQLRKLDGGLSDRVVDKMPDNYQMLGFLAALLPGARFIHCRRDLRDVALSCWITHFSRIRWACHLEHLAHRIREYRRLMAHWRQVLPVAFLEIDYEELTADQEGVSRRLVDWAGLEWAPACLNFHRTERLVRTASVAQVRQPIYRGSVARWKHYETMLRPLLDRIE
jgi:tetratricopeptide (TPR) repeat protein